ncbi:E3 SUMO-protein ligase NSE2-like isoform X4 [Plodia interpunctella]|uniref:E3 SUMO-protein ligase NSE2-like isoform X4 n=1 Tax=Plodia interpunctella TaxID=58824 RepID=UPI0023684E2C|nr:E3 SUMO-protein ligase NSE2-like isoform X4 [Plodia interpunctella]
MVLGWGGITNHKCVFNLLTAWHFISCRAPSVQLSTTEKIPTTKRVRETESSNVDSLEAKFTENLRTLAGKRENVSIHPYMIELTKHFQRGQQVSRQNLDESDLAITETQDQYIDPITKKPIEDPVKNTVCGHIYEKNSIMNLIHRNNRTKCPVAGCGNRGPIQKQHLLTDEELKFRLTITQHSTMIQERSVTNLDDTME